MSTPVLLTSVRKVAGDKGAHWETDEFAAQPTNSISCSVFALIAPRSHHDCG